MIFISIAAYRDPQLVPTIEDCLAKAAHPGDLRFGICWQHGPEESTLPFAGDPRFTILEVDWRESRGACWARAEIMKMFSGEDWFLQLDSHHRFVQDWDDKVLAQAAMTGSAKPILTAYATPFHPDDPRSFGDEPMQMNFDRFTPDAVILFRPGGIADWRHRSTPARARFLSAHFLFAPGSFVNDVPYDADLYFIGEEITLAVRAFSHGYDLFHPTEVIVWHEYTRDYRPHKHWGDHLKANGVEVEWHERDRASLDKVRAFLEEPSVGRFGCGTARTCAEYEAYAGVHFKRRRTTDYTRRFLEPPNPPLPPDWADRVGSYEIEIGIDKAKLPADVDDYLFWFVGFHDASGREIYRLDADKTEVPQLLARDGAAAVVRRTFESENEPISWTVWPYSVSKGWLEKLEGPILSLDPDVTVVTALLDIGRDRLQPSFARSFSAHYLRLFVRLLQINAPMIVHLEPEYEALVWRHRRRDNTQVIPLTNADLEALPWFDRVQDIRRRSDWRDQAAWLAESPQAQLPMYNPLVLSKMRWLNEAAADNPFASSHLFWIDAGLTGTVPEDLLRNPAVPSRLVNATGDFLFAAFPYRDGAEIHGFPRRALARVAGVADVDHVMRGGFFGGRAEAIAGVAADYETLLTETLDAGLMGTEESLFTILAHRQPDRFTCYEIGEDGLLGPFFDALVGGRAADRRLHIVPRITVPEAPPAPRIAFSLPPDVPEEALKGMSVYLDLAMMQNRYAIGAFRTLFHHLEERALPVARIVEIGTGPGGLSAMLQIYCVGADAEFVTYDRHESVRENPVLRELGVNVRIKDVEHEFTIGEIVRELQKDGLTILLCDGPDKAAEVNTLTPYLKGGDIVMAHDYAPNREIFAELMNGRLWSWCEITDADIADVGRRYHLHPLLEEAFAPAAWTCRVKRSDEMTPAPGQLPGDDIVALYVLTFNAPEQFRSWIRSVERADPTLLSATDKVLLNNSTDESLFALYDQLCAEYGFAQYRLGNIGINAGRLWCSRHFFEQSSHAAMLYFEDDMLLYTDAGVCRNGLPTFVPRLLSKAVDILRNEQGLDFLKLSFTEFYGDHRENWAYYNLSPDLREEYFPDGRATRVGALKSYAGVSYMVGDIFYSNWPMLMTRRAVQTMFPGDDDLVLYEQRLMVRALELSRDGLLRGAVLLASPVNHDRQHHYPAEIRKEC